MDKGKLAVGAIAAIVLVGALYGMKMYQGKSSEDTSATATQAATPSAPADPYASYSAPTQQ